MGLFSKFNIPFALQSKKFQSLPSPVIPRVDTIGAVNTYKTIADFELNIEKPKYEGDIPNATVKFYPVDF